MRIQLAFALTLGLGTPAAAQSIAATTVPPVQAGPATAQESGYNYVPNGRRDPFVSLLRRGADAQRVSTATRPGGLSGLTSGEVALKGVMRTRDGFVGILLGADQKSYIVRPGDKLLDGAVRTIAADAVVIVQQLNDPLAPQKQREVRKMLRQSEEAK